MFVFCFLFFVFTKHALGIEVGRNKSTVAFQGFLGSQAGHVGHLQDVLQIFVHVPDKCKKKRTEESQREGEK